MPSLLPQTLQFMRTAATPSLPTFRKSLLHAPDVPPTLLERLGPFSTLLKMEIPMLKSWRFSHPGRRFLQKPRPTTSGSPTLTSWSPCVRRNAEIVTPMQCSCWNMKKLCSKCSKMWKGNFSAGKPKVLQSKPFCLLRSPGCQYWEPDARSQSRNGLIWRSGSWKSS